MAVYRGKTIEAWQVGSGPGPDWLSVDGNAELSSSQLTIRATKGIEVVRVGDWVIKDEDGTVRTMADGKFRLRYDEVLSGSQQLRADSTRQTTQPTEANATNSGLNAGDPNADSARQVTRPQPDVKDKGYFRTPEAIREGIDQRASTARPAVHKHKPGEYND